MKASDKGRIHSFASPIARQTGAPSRAATTIADYVAREWDSIRWTVGCYEIEGAGVQLFDRVEGDPWTIIGMPMLPLMAWLRTIGLAQK